MLYCLFFIYYTSSFLINKGDKNEKRKIQLGRIYRVEDGSKYGHPGMPYKAYKKKGKYDVIKFTTSKTKAYRLNKNINPSSKKCCFVRKRPERVGDNYIGKEFSNYKVVNYNDKQIIKRVKRNKVKIWHKKKK